MKRFKKPKQSKKPDEKLIRRIADEKTDEMLAKVAEDMAETLYPVMLLAVKDHMLYVRKIKFTDDDIKEIDNRTERYINYIGDKSAEIGQVKDLLTK